MKDKQPSGHKFLDPAKALLDAGLKEGQRVADLGCGAGYFVMPAARIVGSQGVVYAVDVFKPALSAVSSKARLFNLPTIKTVWANVEIYGACRGIHDQSLDMVLLVQLLSQSGRHQQIFKEADRLLKKGGQMLVIDWHNDQLTFSPGKKKILSPEEVMALAAKNYLQLVKPIRVGAYHFGLVFRKN